MCNQIVCGTESDNAPWATRVARAAGNLTAHWRMEDSEAIASAEPREAMFGIVECRSKEERSVKQVLKKTKGMAGANAVAARRGLNRTTLQSRMRGYNIARLFQ